MARPIYPSVVAACKVGCFCCGSSLDPSRARRLLATPSGWEVSCDSCGDPTEFEIGSRPSLAPAPSSSPPPRKAVGQK
jgi:hypothetical protein